MTTSSGSVSEWSGVTGRRHLGQQQAVDRRAQVRPGVGRDAGRGSRRAGRRCACLTRPRRPLASDRAIEQDRARDRARSIYRVQSYRASMRGPSTVSRTGSRFMPLDHYVTLGRSGLRVSPFALGAMTFGEDPGGAGCSVEESEKILATYLDRGGNFVDTANFYTNGHSEKILGDYFAARPGRRDRVVLASKFFANMFPGDPNGGGAGPRVDHRPAATRPCAGCRPTTSTCTGCTTGTATPRSRRPCARSTTWSAPARSATSASPTPRPGSPPRPRRRRCCGAGRR